MRLTGYIMIEENGCYKTNLWIKDVVLMINM